MAEEKFVLTQQEIESLCKAGGMAPSGGNVQPWSITVDQDTFTIKLDKSRSENFLDVGHYASYFGIGCFLENALIKAESLGLNHNLTYHEFNSIDDPLVTIKFEKKEKNSTQILEPFIEQRITNRHISNGIVIDEKVMSDLKQVIEEDSNYQLSAISSFDGKDWIADILGEADAIRMLNDEAYQEMMSEFRWTEDAVVHTKDGLDMKTLELPGNAEKLYQLLRDYPFLRKVLPRKALSEMARPLLVGCSHMCCLSTSGPLNPQAMLRAGQLFERLWLTTTRLGIALQPWSITPFFLIRLNYYAGEGFSLEEKKKLKNVEENLSDAFSYSPSNIPLFIFRLSYTDRKPSAHSLRRSWKEFTKIR